MSGLKQNEITQFIVPDTGLTLPVRKVSYVLVQDVQRQARKEFPEPQPPVQMVDYGNGPEPERNLAHPDYLVRHKEWEDHLNEEMEERTRRLLIKVGVTPYLKWDQEKEDQVRALRETLKEFGVNDLDPDDKYVWVTRIAMGTVEDWSDFTTYLMRRNQATEAGIQDALKNSTSA